MTMDRVSWEYHLSPHGWKQGTSRYFDSVQGLIIDRPQDAIMTLLHESTQENQWTREEARTTCTWTATKISSDILERLLRSYGTEPWKKFNTIVRKPIKIKRAPIILGK